MRLTLREIKFICEPRRDRTVLISWEKGEISVIEAAELISRNNKISPPLDSGEFVQMAHMFGYWKELPFDLKFAIREYGETHGG
jgi:hypothetical protein